MVPLFNGRSGSRRGHGFDFLIALLLASLAFTLNSARMHELGDTIAMPELDSGWFQADTADFYPMFTRRGAGQGDIRVHPLFSMAVAAPAIAVRQAFGLTDVQSVQWTLSAATALWIVGLFVLLRVMACPRPDTLVFSFLALASGAGTFWFAVPESYPFGSATLVIVLIVAAIGGRKEVRERWFVLASAASFSMTVTNWMAGAILALTRFPWRRAAQITVNAFCLVVVLWGVQKFLFPNTPFFLESGRVLEMKTRFLFHPHAGGPLAILQSFFLHTMVVPEIIQRPDAGASLKMVTQRSWAGSGGWLSPVAVVLWIGLLGLAVRAFSTTRGVNTHLKKVVGWTLLGQLVLHLIYGDETFLYSLHFLPLFLAGVAFVSLSRYRRWGLGLALALTVCAGIHNHGKFEEAATRMQTRAAELRTETGQHP